MYTSERINSVSASKTLYMSQLAAKLKAEGRNVISMAGGEPDFDTPEHIKQAAVDAINKGCTKYTAVDGIAELKTAICNKFRIDNNLNYDNDNIIVSTGAKQSLYNIVQVLVQEGDEVIIAAPYWVSYPEFVNLAGAKSVIVKTSIDTNFKMTAQQLKNSITSKTKMIILNSPSNPSGQAYSESELKELSEVLLDYPKIAIISDEIYEHIWWGDKLNNILNVCPDLMDRCFIVNGVSKSYSMTGWRIGYAAGPKKIINACKRLQSHSTSNPTSISQYAALAALQTNSDIIDTFVRKFKDRNKLILDALYQIKLINTLPSFGSFYVFPDCSDFIKHSGMKDDIEFTEKLLNEASVAAVPGSAFGQPGCIRLSYATSEDNISEALTRIEQFINHLAKQ